MSCIFFDKNFDRISNTLISFLSEVQVKYVSGENKLSKGETVIYIR